MYKVNVSNKISEHQILKIYAGFKHKSENIDKNTMQICKKK